MADVFSKEKRSEVMSRIRSRNTKPELLVRKYLFAQGFRFRLHSPKLPSKPDIVLPRYKTLVFIQGCFWHGHNCKIARTPKSNIEFWTNKINRNKERDYGNFDILKKMGWRVIIIWECSLKKRLQEQTLSELASLIRQPFE